MNASSASARTKLGISHAPVLRICARPSSTNDQSRSTRSCMPAMVRSPHFFRLAGSAGQSPTTIEGNWSVDEEFRLAEGQYGLMTRSQLRERGLTDRQIQY